MNGYYPLDQGAAGDGMMGIMGQDASASSMIGAQSLDDIVHQNAKAMRRQSVPMHYGTSRDMDGDMRRVSMMEFSGASPGQLDQFQFDPTTAAPSVDSMMRMGDAYDQRAPSFSGRRRPSTGDLNIDTRYANQAQSYAPMTHPHSAFASPLDMANAYVTSGMPMPMAMADPSLNGLLPPEAAPMNMFSGAQFTSPLMGSPVTADFNDTLHIGPLQDPGSGQGSMDINVGSDTASQSVTTPTDMLASRGGSREQSVHSNRQQSSSMSQAPLQQSTTPTSNAPSQSKNVSFGPEPPQRNMGTTRGPNGQTFPWKTPEGGFPSTMTNRPHMEGQFKNVYSSTGFDMLGVLMRVATRPNPEINIGSVDLSCAFVVCDAEKDDNPIVYCSENFERLTGYTKHMILGRNCRFLQSPDGKVESGIKRKYVDDESVLYLKNQINAQREAQISLINYRRGGQPFMNLLTMIPITWDDTEVVKFIVGFQVDLVEQPNSVTNKNPDGSYSINYQRSMGMPKYVFQTPENTHSMDMGQTISHNDVSNLLETFVSGESDATKRMWDKALLENTDDVIHVLSLKGLFLYSSPSAAKVLEYEASELVGTALSSVCHPSDIVPVTRELKDTSTGSTVNIVFRIRRKHSGYMWFEGHGSLHTEQGKGRKCIILVGRERPVYALSKKAIDEQGGIGENELWSKMSTSGMFLYVSSHVRSLLDRQPEDLVGTSIQQLMRLDSRSEFFRILEIARTGRAASVKHEMINKRGQVLQAFTTLYPGDAVPDLKPTFLIAQTRLVKFARGSTSSNVRPTLQKHDRDSGSSIQSLGSTNTGANTVVSASTNLTSGMLEAGLHPSQYISTENAAVTHAGQQGLRLGHQDASLAAEDNIFDELKTTRSTSWQYELRQMEKRNRLLAEEVQSLLAAKKKRKRRKGAGQLQKDCANCHTRVTPEWRRGPSGNRDLCNSCGLRWAKQNGRVSPRTTSQHSVHSAGSDKASKAGSPLTQSMLPHHTDAGGETSIPSTVENQPATPGGQGTRAIRSEVAASQGVDMRSRNDEGRK
ncbi:uncharacterized protein K452DRAFT_316550 [Aplosporella prunicola CBS 121167]|uniref:Blue light regulator 1 n=1 Tax=Aplosporella prunicola CBS 121167 TaxID=1176127 RepID=A0A6A6BKB4_9PEZI|nr:uncharacterized protein K452DRAFT_316550 [Aplosporella prunicola CBS 121167]KAF2144580.1 hypothetical protein K452DRAFT_316550 [Aplosporella prunicola CBS 121167]